MNFDHKQWLKDFQIASAKKEGFRELRAQIFKDTVKFVQSGYVINGKQINIDNECIISEFFTKPPKLLTDVRYNSNISVVNTDCLKAAKNLLDSGFNPCVLNMASRQNPGGGVLGGAGAQFVGFYKTIVFAIIDDHNSRKAHNPNGNFLPFAEIFRQN